MIPMLKKALLLIALIGVCAVVPVFAQQDTAITVGVPEFWRAFSMDSILDEFEAQHPGVRVEPVYLPFDSTMLPSTDDINDHLDAALELAQSADVVQVAMESLSPYATQAGYFLDLTPLTTSDMSLNPADFVHGAWESFQWDNGTWAVPAKVDPLVLIYDPAAFDRAGLTYPNASWTLEDVAAAASVLTQRDASGTVTMPGLVTFGNDEWLLRSLLGQSLFDTSVVPASPRFATPEVQALLERWAELVNDGVVAAVPANTNAPTDSPPMQINGTYALAAPLMENVQAVTLASSALPGGSIGLPAYGFAVSAGTAQPQLAYDLARFLSQNPQLLQMIQGSQNALTTVGAPQPFNDDNGGGGIMIAGGMPLSPEQESAINALLPNALPASELRYGPTLNAAINRVISGGSDSASALQNAELAVINALQTASDRRGTAPIAVATALPLVVLNPGEISLHFGAGFTAQTGAWDTAMRDFAALDPQVGEVVLDTNFGQTSDYVQRDDCFYLNYNAVPSADLSQFLPIDPLLSADPSFSAEDAVGNTLAQLQRDNHTWAYPFVISPALLNYYPDLFARAGIPEPTDGWTISEFVDALRALEGVITPEQTPFTNRGIGDTYLLLLVAAYGGQTFDTSTNPPTPRFTDPAFVEAARQVLDLVKADLIDYQQLASNMFSITVSGGDNPDPLYSDAGGGAVMMFGGPAQNASNPYRLVGYPSGALNAVSYEIDAGYISASAQNPDACYRLFQFLATRPDLFGGMPAFRSQFDNPALIASAGQNAVNFYRQYDAILSDRSTVVIPSAFSGSVSTSGMNVTRRWLDQAFDGYVLEDGDLSALLTEAQTKASAFQVCVSALPPFDAAQPEAYINSVRDCAVSVDPNAADMFPSTSP